MAEAAASPGTRFFIQAHPPGFPLPLRGSEFVSVVNAREIAEAAQGGEDALASKLDETNAAVKKAAVELKQLRKEIKSMKTMVEAARVYEGLRNKSEEQKRRQRHKQLKRERRELKEEVERLQLTQELKAGEEKAKELEQARGAAKQRMAELR